MSTLAVLTARHLTVMRLRVDQIRNLRACLSDCQTVVEAYLSRFKIGDISGRIVSKLALNWNHRQNRRVGYDLKGMSRHVTLMKILSIL